MRLSILAAACAAAFSTVSLPSTAFAGEAQAATLGPSGLPLPRFVSVKASRLNMRIGPGREYPVDWTYTRTGLPFEIIQEYDNWRRVRDASGTEGWVYQSMLSGKRTAIAAPWQEGKDVTVALYADPSDDAAIAARVEPGAVGKVETCDGKWCQIDFSGHKGYMNQEQIWGVYPGETVDD